MFVRWDNLDVHNGEQHRLPGYRDVAIRRFDAPEALETRFYEVEAKSALNKVPAASRMPFRWTVNPYRGCSHACTYCASGDTQVLLIDGRTAAMRDLRVGDLIYGTSREGRYRRFVPTHVLDKWSSVKPAYAVTLEDGTELIASADHRFLSTRGWKHVTGAGYGPLQRPHLAPGLRLIGPGGCVAPPVVDDDYRRGYLCGMIRGDGHLGAHVYDRPGRRSSTVHRFRLALADVEALERGSHFLEDLGVSTTRFAFSTGSAGHRPIEAIRAYSRPACERIEELIAWPVFPTMSWIKGFLAGSLTPRVRVGGLFASRTRTSRSSTGCGRVSEGFISTT